MRYKPSRALFPTESLCVERVLQHMALFPLHWNLSFSDTLSIAQTVPFCCLQHTHMFLFIQNYMHICIHTLYLQKGIFTVETFSYYFLVHKLISQKLSFLSLKRI